MAPVVVTAAEGWPQTRTGAFSARCGVFVIPCRVVLLFAMTFATSFEFLPTFFPN